MSSLPKKFMKQTINAQDYEASIDVLNSLESNAEYIKLKYNKTKYNKLKSQSTNCNPNDELKQLEKYLNRTGISLDNLDELSVIHVAGTKGKGTTCAFSERILREHGYKTGFFSSPHLLEVRERIRINGKPISRDEFARYFWKIYMSLEKQKSDETDMPFCFRFLTIMAFTVFIDKKVDVAIVEVGLGGEYDCTNILQKVPVVGITSVGIDHTSLLGSTIESIAWNKGGIMKEGCRAFTVPQSEQAMTVLKQRSIEKKCQLDVINDLHFKFPANTSCLANILNLNASLAEALCKTWLAISNNNNELNCSFSKEITEKAIADCVWPGRFQIKQEKTITYYLDGAHTYESISICSNWFKEVTKHSNKKKALIFNVTGNRDAERLLTELINCNFNAVLFVTNCASKSDKLDNLNFKTTDELLEKCQHHKQVWLHLEKEPKTKICEIFPVVREAIEFLANHDTYDLLVTGSIHLIGSVLSIIDPNMNDCLGY